MLGRHRAAQRPAGSRFAAAKMSMSVMVEQMPLEAISAP